MGIKTNLVLQIWSEKVNCALHKIQLYSWFLCYCYLFPFYWRGVLAPAYPTFLPTPVALTMILYHITFASKQLHVSNWMEKTFIVVILSEISCPICNRSSGPPPCSSLSHFLWHEATTVRIFLLPPLVVSRCRWDASPLQGSPHH